MEDEEVQKNSQVEYYKKKIIDLKQENRTLAIVFCGIGDLTAIWMLLYEREIVDGWKSFVPIVSTAYWNRLLKCYPGKIEEAVVLPVTAFKVIATDIDFLNQHGIRYDAYKSIKTVRNCFCRLLDIPVDTKYRKFPIHSHCREYVEDYFKCNQLILGKTVFICPYAHCFGSKAVSRDYWKKLSKAIRHSGGHVFLTVKLA